MISLPEEGRGLRVIASVSGGKDSTALILALREAGIAARYVFADTGWEAPETLEYLDYLRERLGIVIDVVRSRHGGLVDIARKKAGFPMRLGRWCTISTKIEPLREYFDSVEATDGEAISALGIRAEESEKRAAMPVFEDSQEWGGYVWRPLLAWTVSDVLEIHNLHGVKVNPLYHRGHSRVGCYPCIFADKEEIRLVADHSPSRIDEIRRLEEEFTVERARRNADGTGDFKHPEATFFSPRVPGVIAKIDDVVAWSRTERGGKQLPLIAPPPRGGCMRWGICDLPQNGGDK